LRLPGTYISPAETELYYLQSRYYDPEVGRFINGDDIAFLGADGTMLSNNLFAYCKNNPVLGTDDSGNFGLFAIKALVGAVVNVTTTYIAAKATAQDYTLKDAIWAAASGAANAIPVVGPLISGAISGCYTGITAYENGASLGASIGCGIFAGVCTAASISNIAGAQPSGIGIGTGAVVDLVFGTGYNSMSAAVYKATITNARKPESGVTSTSTTKNKFSGDNGRRRNRAVSIIERELLIK